MRYHELLETRRRRPRRPLILPQPFKADVKIVLRFLPAVYRWFRVELCHGGPYADITINHARVWFPEPYDAEGALTADCQQWIVEMVRDEVERLGLSMTVVFSSNEAVALWPGEKTVISTKPPEGGLLI